MAMAKERLMRNRFQFSFAVLLVTNLFAANFTVKTDGSGDHTTIQAAINASSNGDTILVYAGTYTENIDYGGKNVVIGSLYMTTSDTSYISSTIIDGGANGSVVQINSGETSAELTGFTIQNGKHAYGGGIAIDGTTVKIKRCRIKDNHSPLNASGSGPGGSGGGGIMVRNENSASVTIEYCEI